MTAADAACMWIGRVISGLWIVTIGAIILAAVDGRVRDFRETRRNRRRDDAYTRTLGGEWKTPDECIHCELSFGPDEVERLRAVARADGEQAQR